jgi:adenylate kinase
MKKIIILLGVPGSGKGTQAKLIAKTFDYVHISTGDLLRRLENDPAGDLQDKAMLMDMKAGRLVSADLIYKLSFKEMEKYFLENKGVVLDGAIRSAEQAKKFQEFFINQKLESEVIAIEVAITDAESLNRLTKRRMCVACGEIVPWLPATYDLTACPKCDGELKPRQDDNPAIAEKRIKEQGNTVIEPILKYYEKLGMLRKVDGMKDIEGVEKEIDEVIKY